MIGSRVVNELVHRGHSVKVVAHAGSNRTAVRPPLIAVAAEATNSASVAEAVRGADAVISAIGPGRGQSPSVIVGGARGLLQGLRTAEVRRLIVVGGAGSLEVRTGVRLADTPEFPEAWRPVADAHREALEVFRGEPELEWTVVSPAAIIEPGARTGRYRAGGEQLMVDSKGESRISAEDFAVAIADELETPRHVRRRFSVVGSA